MKGEVPEGSGAETLRGSGGFWRRYLVRFRSFRRGSGGFQRRYLERFRRVVQMLCEAPNGSDVFLWHKHLILQQKSSGEASGEFWRNVDIRFLQVWCAIQIVFCQVPVQHPKVPEGTGVWYWKKC